MKKLADGSSVDSNKEAMIAASLASTEEVEVRNVFSGHFIHDNVCYVCMGEKVHMVKVGISALQHRSYLNGLTISMNHHTVIIDSGADTCNLSQRWHVVEENPTRRVRVIGFDKERATKNNLSIVTTIYVFESPTGECILLR